MTNEDIIRMARETGLWPAVTDSFPKEMQEFANLVAATEREACARLCEEMASWHGDLVTAAYDSAADAIRKRGQG
jgi:hypothetical protein